MIKIGMTGGIGSGKSTVCRVFGLLGIPWYDSDAEAKRLMNADAELRAAIAALFGPEAYAGGELDRGLVARVVFNEAAMLEQLNRLVHPAVGRDFDAWAQRQEAPYVIEESAILFESGAARKMDRTVAVLAPEALRVRRAAQGMGISENAVRDRMANQMADAELARRADHLIHADERQLVIPQILELHRLFLQL